MGFKVLIVGGLGFRASGLGALTQSTCRISGREALRCIIYKCPEIGGPSLDPRLP